jgi:hypothetical protein
MRKPTDVFISLFINRVSAVDESKEVSSYCESHSCSLCTLHCHAETLRQVSETSRFDPTKCE